MNPIRLVLTALVVSGLLHPEKLSAQDLPFAAPFGPTQQFSADVIITTPDGSTLTQKMFCDSGKVRTEMTIHGMAMISIQRPDLKKVYNVMVAQKIVMEAPDPGTVQVPADATPGPRGKFEVVGPDTVDGGACIKYKGMAARGDKVFFYWVDASTKAPVKMVSEDNSLTMVWKNYMAGPQDPSLFEPPAGYQVMNTPGMSGAAPGGAGQ